MDDFKLSKLHFYNFDRTQTGSTIHQWFSTTGTRSSTYFFPLGTSEVSFLFVCLYCFQTDLRVGVKTQLSSKSTSNVCLVSLLCKDDSTESYIRSLVKTKVSHLLGTKMSYL